MSKIPNRSASCLAKLLRCLQDNWPAISHDLAVEATRFEGFPKATNAKMVVEEGMFSGEGQVALCGCRILGELSQLAVAGD